MAFEVACSECEGRLMVEQAGVIVACPHCGAHLKIDAPVESEASSPDGNVDPPAEQPVDESPADSGSQPEVSEPETEAVAPPAEVESVPVVQPADSTPDSETPVGFSVVTDAPAEIVGEPMPYIGEPIAATTETTATDATNAISESTTGATEIAATEDVPRTSAETEATRPTTEDSPVSPQVPATNAGSPGNFPAQNYAPGRRVSPQSFSLLRNYAIAMTLAVIFLIYKLLNPNMSALESLPDVKPPKKDDKIVYKLVPEATEMPPGHLLSLGQSQRFGNLKVTPIRVTREPIEFVHHLGDTGVSREPGPDVVKLWFEFENLSSDQSIAPLDGLVFKRDDNDFENVRSNNFACRLSQKKKGGELAFVYDLNEGDIWNLRDQNVNWEIAPGEKLETYIPTTEEGVAQLVNSDESLVWRVHFRKGYSPKNYGVTTVIEVAFESSDISTGSSASETAATAKASST
ncbi:MAG: hypothetical protein HQ518_07565 [Rhodopirellula sp.]|nr:hypothetical protein [Rhodopirellula sp.]